MWLKKVLFPKRPVDPSALEQLSVSKAQYDDAVKRGGAVANLSSWFDARREHNHFGDDLDISFVRRNHA